MCAGIWLNENLFGYPQTYPELGLGSDFLEDSFFFIPSTIKQWGPLCVFSNFPGYLVWPTWVTGPGYLESYKYV